MTRTIAGTPVNPIGLGCMNLSWAYGTPPDEPYASQLLNRALDLGCNHLDTANIYGGGKNEECETIWCCFHKFGFWVVESLS